MMIDQICRSLSRRFDFVSKKYWTALFVDGKIRNYTSSVIKLWSEVSVFLGGLKVGFLWETSRSELHKRCRREWIIL
jgi:hypothetical protein